MATKEEKLEEKAVEGMIAAKAIADDIFGAQSDADAVHDVYDWLEIAPSVEEFTTDLRRIHGHAARIHKTPTPTPDQVFGLFERIFERDE